MARRGPFVLALGMAAVLAAASAAAACTPMLAMYPLSSPAGDPGKEVTVKGTSPSTDPVEVRWDGIRGPMLGTASVDEETGAFSIDVEIPEAAPGLHYVVAVGGASKGGDSTGWSRAPFKVAGPAPPLHATPTLGADQAQGGLTADGYTWQSATTDGGSPISQTTIGIAVLALGSVSLAVGFGMLGVRRSRARVDGSEEGQDL